MSTNEIEYLEIIPRPRIPQGRNKLKFTWAFKFKRLLDETPLKHKDQFYVSDNLQTERVYYFEIYAPIIQWLTIRLLPTLIPLNN